MKLALLTILFMSSISYAREIKDFNQALFDKVNKDIQNDNVEEFKTKKEVTRGPASVLPSGKESPDTKIDKNLKQLGHSKW